jgi:hypothetical protein
MADDVRDRGITKERALQIVASITGQRFTDLRDPAISAAMARANMAAGGDPVGSCVYRADGDLQCQDNITEPQCTGSYFGTWDPDVTCLFRPEIVPHPTPNPVAAPMAAVLSPVAAKPRAAKPRAAKPATKKAVKKAKAPRAAKRAPAAARSKPKKKVAAKPKRRVVKAAAKKKPKPAAKKKKRR